MIKRLQWIIFATLSIAVALYPVIYFVMERPFGLMQSKSNALLVNVFWNIGFYTHITLGGIALLIGWMQFSEKFRNRNLQLHRNIGKVYVIAVLLSSLAGFGIAFAATGGNIPKIGFGCLGILWFCITFIAYTSIKNGNITKHREMMIYSYAACFAAVTLRIWLPLLIIYFHDFLPAYRIVSWLSWVPNMIVAYFIVRSSRTNKKILR